MLQQDLDTGYTLAASSSDRISPLPEERVFCASGSAGSSVCAIGQCITAECISRGTEFPTEFPPSESGALLTKTTPWVTSHSKVAGLLSANAPTIRGHCTVVGKAVGADYRAIGQVAKQQVREFLCRISAAEWNIAATDDCMIADVLFRPGSPSVPARARQS